MKLGLDISSLVHLRTGVGNYVYELSRSLLEQEAADIRGYAVGRMRLDWEALPATLTVDQVQVPTSLGYWAWRRMGWPTVESIVDESLDVAHGTNFFLPATRNAKRVISVHDICFTVHPEWMNRKVVSPYADYLADFCTKADAIITFSEFTKGEMVEHYGAEAEKIHVTPHGIRQDWCTFDREAAQDCVKRYGVEGPYVLFVGTIEERKNVVRLLEAFAELSDLPHRLVIVGQAGWMPKPLERLLDELGLRDRVHLPGFVAHDDLSAFYVAADAFVFPSHYEGFGFPVLEAFVCGCPVVTSNSTSLPEVGGDAAEYVDPMDVADIARGIETVVTDSERADGMRERGRLRAAEFDWLSTADKTLQVYRSVMP